MGAKGIKIKRLGKTREIGKKKKLRDRILEGKKLDYLKREKVERKR